MENSEIMQRLAEENSHSEQSNKSAGSKKKDEELSIVRIRIVTAKYKVYIVLLLIFICILLMGSIPSMKEKYNSTMNSYKTEKTKLIGIQNEIKDAENDVKLLGEIIDNEESIKTCLNKQKNCSNLPETRKESNEEESDYDFTIPLSYLQVHSLYNKKMPVDEKKVLKNLNEYLIKQDISGGSKTRVGDILKISIGDPEAVTQGDEHFFEVPVDVTIEFKTIGNLTGFLYNVEKRLIDNGEDRILYKIQSISYDVVSKDEAQTTDISMLAYYYHDERFQDIDKKVVDSDKENNSLTSEESDIQEESENMQEETSEDFQDTSQTNEEEKSISGFFKSIFKR